MTHLTWQDGQPFSTRFNDVYFSRDHGLEETEYVFLRQNLLAERFAACQNDSFSIAETGFGSALNFVATLDLWQKKAPPAAHLHYISVEKYPLSPSEMRTALELWPQYSQISLSLLAQYMNLPSGTHRMRFLDGRVTLTLVIGDLTELLAQLNARPIPVDAWFLDGFAPAKNPEMWPITLFQTMAYCAHAQTSFATFTSAGSVRRGLHEAGFNVEKVAGVGKKREMLRGHFAKPAVKTISHSFKRAAIIGAGIAGCATAQALAARGWHVQLLEKRAGIAQAASGNPMGILYPRLAARADIAGRFSLASYLYTLRLLQTTAPEANIHAACGLMQLAFSSAEIARARKLAQQHTGLVEWLEASQASALAGVNLAHGALYLPHAGWIRPQALCEALCIHDNIEIKYHTNALELMQTDGGWQVNGENGVLAEAEIVVVANADAAKAFPPLAHLPLEIARGQATLLRADAYSKTLKMILCGDGYITPASNGAHALGASFVSDDADTHPRLEEDVQNLAHLRAISPSLHQALAHQIIGNHVATRCLSPDHLPLAGPVLDSSALHANPPRYNANPATLPWIQGLYVNIAHGSKGYTSAPMCAELLASLICGELLPLEPKLVAAINPNRFVLKALGAKALVAASANGTW